MVPSIKGNLFILTKTYLSQRFGPEAIGKILPLLNESDRAILIKPSISGLWESELTYNSFLTAADKTFGKGDYALCHEIGYSNAKNGVPKLYQIFIRFGDPAFVIKRAASFWSQVHSHGSLEIMNISPKNVIGIIRRYEVPSKAFCYSFMGYITGVLELSGAKNVVTQEKQCILSGSPHCKYEAHWE